MSNHNINMDEAFRDAFGDWEPEVDPSEMQADWTQVSSRLPQMAPQAAPQAPTANPLSIVKLLGLGASAVAVITAGVLYFNTSATQPEIGAKNTEPVVTQTEVQAPATESKEANRPVNPGIALQNETDGTASKGYVTASQNRNSDNAPRSSSVNYSRGMSNNNSSANTAINLASVPGQYNPATPAGNKTPDINAETQGRNMLPDTILCMNEPFNFQNAGPADVQVEWGDGRRSIVAPGTTIHNYTSSGKYFLRVEGNGAVSSRLVQVRPSPHAGFSFNPGVNGLVRFTQISEYAVRLLWDFGDRSGDYYSYSPEHNYSDSGKYRVRMIAFAEGGCSDTVFQDLRISNHAKVSPPNVFTPNGDGINEFFEIPLEGESMFELTITNALTQETVFHSTDKKIMWDGNNMKDGKACPEGQYYYILNFQFPGEKMKNLPGFVRLSR